MWVAVGDKLPCQREQANSEDLFAVAVTKGELILGHFPKKFPQFAWCFYDEVGSILSLDTRLYGNALRFLNLSGKNLRRKKFSGEEIFTGRNFCDLAFHRENSENFPLYGKSLNSV